MNNPLAKKFTLPSLMRFALPNVFMMITLSMYVIVDGMFIARFLGTTALSAANMIYPIISFEMALAIMLSTGGSAIVARKLGEGKQQEAVDDFSFLIIVELLLGVIIAVIGRTFLDSIITFIGASNLQFSLCLDYARILFIFAPAFFLQTAFQTFFVTAGKSTLGLIVTLAAGVMNIALDYLFMVPLQMGIEGAAIATGIGYCLPAMTGICFFLRKKDHPLHLVKPVFNMQTLLQSIKNGSSEMVTNLANAVTTFLFNFMFLHYYGEDGVASITIILYFQYIFTALYFGFANGIAPIISFKYGCKDYKQLQSIFKSSFVFLFISTLVSNLIIHLTIKQALTIFTTIDSNVFAITIQGFSFYSIAFLFMGVAIFASALFTALSDGKISAIISFTRTFLFITSAIVILPHFMGSIGLWLAVPFAELLGLSVAIWFLFSNRKKYGYIALS